MTKFNVYMKIKFNEETFSYRFVTSYAFKAPLQTTTTPSSCPVPPPAQSNLSQSEEDSLLCSHLYLRGRINLSGNKASLAKASGRLCSWCKSATLHGLYGRRPV